MRKISFYQLKKVFTNKIIINNLLMKLYLITLKEYNQVKVKKYYMQLNYLFSFHLNLSHRTWE